MLYVVRTVLYFLCRRKYPCYRETCETHRKFTILDILLQASFTLSFFLGSISNGYSLSLKLLQKRNEARQLHVLRLYKKNSLLEC